jgi:hypothetical protein
MNSYTVSMICTNCGYNFIQSFEKGERVEEKLVYCPSCEVVGDCHKK